MSRPLWFVVGHVPNEEPGCFFLFGTEVEAMSFAQRRAQEEREQRDNGKPPECYMFEVLNVSPDQEGRFYQGCYFDIDEPLRRREHA